MSDVVTLELPTHLFQKLQALAEAEHTDPVTVMTRLISLAHQRQEWLQNLETLRHEIRQAGGLSVSASRETVIKELRQIRRDIFETEYAHLYR